MTVAHIVPLRRLPPERSWFDYRVPDNLDVAVGQLVEIEFGRQTMTGIVWELTDASSVTGLKDIQRIVRPDTILTSWQHELISRMAEWYFVSLGHLVARAVPDWPKNPDDNELTPLPAPPLRSAPDSHERIWWYRDRHDAIHRSLDWLLKDDVPRLICTPTGDDVNDFREALGPDGLGVGWIDGRITPRDYRVLYERVRRGQCKKVIGTGQSLLLPFVSKPSILLDQDDHPAHRQGEQHPRLDNRQTIALVAPQAIITSPAPSLRTFIDRHPLPPAFSGHRQLFDLGQPGSRDWLTPQSEDYIQTAIQRGHHVLTIVPHHGFAQQLTCRECGWTVTCQRCHSRVRLTGRSSAHVDCQKCGSAVQVPASCPQCQSVRWKFSGLGADQFVEILHTRWPKTRIHQAGQPWPDEPCITVGTYQSFRFNQHVQSTLIVSGDALLSYPDYAVAERAWAFLARLQAVRPDNPVAVQTYEPDLAFWQRWRHGDDRSWYADEVQQRTVLSVPPMAEHWMARLPTGDIGAVEKKYDEIVGRLPPGVRVTHMPLIRGQRGRTTGRLLLQAPIGQSLRTLLDWNALFPPPWQLDPALRGWAD